MKVQKDMRGSWSAESEYPLDELSGYILKVLTMKRSNGDLVTTATVNKIDGPCLVQRWNDYSNRVLVETTRVTEKAVRGQHELALLQLPRMLSEAVTHTHILNGDKV